MRSEPWAREDSADWVRMKAPVACLEESSDPDGCPVECAKSAPLLMETSVEGEALASWEAGGQGDLPQPPWTIDECEAGPACEEASAGAEAPAFTDPAPG